MRWQELRSQIGLTDEDLITEDEDNESNPSILDFENGHDRSFLWSQSHMF